MAIVTGASDTAVAWSISPNYGTITQGGLYTAPGSVAGAPIVTVTATSQADPTKTGSTSIAFYDPNLDSSSSSPGPAYPIRGTFLDFYRSLTPDLWALEFQYMKQINIDTIVIVSVGQLQANSDGTYGLSPNGLLYPSNYLPPSARPTDDRLELLLSLADSQGMNIYLGSLQTADTWSNGDEFGPLRQWNQQVESEIIQRYGRHASLKGWYFTQEIWMNWVKADGGANYDASAYYGTQLMANWVADLKSLDPTKLATAAVVVKETGSGSMPGLTAGELQQTTFSTRRLPITTIFRFRVTNAALPPARSIPILRTRRNSRTERAGDITTPILSPPGWGSLITPMEKRRFRSPATWAA